MDRVTGAVSVFVAVVVASGCRTPRIPDAARSVSGCYAFFHRSGRPAAESLYWAPSTGRLAPGGAAERLTPVRDAGGPAGLPGAYGWSVDSLGDSLRVVFHNGHSGTAFIFGLRTDGDTLRGRARSHWDVGPPFASDAGAASAVRISCDASTGSGSRAPDV
jgi:hypothetical protein